MTTREVAAYGTAGLLAVLLLKGLHMFDWRDYLAKQKTTPEPPPDHHFWLELDPHEHDALHELIYGRDSGLSTTQTVTLRERLRDARRISGPRLVEARLDWDELEATASKQGCSPADVFFDRAKGKDE